MLSFLRNQSKGILIVVAAVIIVAFTFLYDPNKDLVGQQSSRVSVAGKDVSNDEYNRILKGRSILLQGLQQWNYVLRLDGLDRRWGSNDPNTPNNDDYVVNTILVAKEAERLGIKVSRDEIKELVEGLYQFQQNGEFDLGTWENFITNISRSGYNEASILKLIGQTIAYQKLRELISAGVTPSPREIQEEFEDKHSKVFASSIVINKADLEDKVEATDEEIAKHYEENKDSYKSPEKRGVTYVYFENPKKQTPEPAAEGEEAPPAESDAEFEARQKEYQKILSDFDLRIANPAEGETFESIAAEEKYAAISSGISTHEPFSQEDPPAELLEKQQLIDAVFQALSTKELGTPFSDGSGYYFFKLNGIEEPATLTLEEARVKVAEDVIAIELAALVNETAAEAKATITSALSEGKTIQGAAEAAGLTASEVPMFSSGQPPVGVPDAQLVQTTAASVKPGEVSNPQMTETGALLVYLESRELPLDIDEDAQKATIQRSIESRDEDGVFAAWFAARKDSAEPVSHGASAPLPPAS